MTSQKGGHYQPCSNRQNYFQAKYLSYRSEHCFTQRDVRDVRIGGHATFIWQALYCARFGRSREAGKSVNSSWGSFFGLRARPATRKSPCLTSGPTLVTLRP